MDTTNENGFNLGAYFAGIWRDFRFDQYNMKHCIP